MKNKYTMGFDPYEENEDSQGSYACANPYDNRKSYYEIQDFYKGDVVISQEASEQLKTLGHFDGFEEYIIKENSKSIFIVEDKNGNKYNKNMLKGLYSKIYSVFL